MFALGQEVDEAQVVNQKIQAMQNVAQFRDELFEGSQGKVVKIVGGAVIGMYVIYRFLMK